MRTSPLLNRPGAVASAPDDPAAQPGSALDPAEPTAGSFDSSAPASDDAEPTA